MNRTQAFVYVRKRGAVPLGTVGKLMQLDYETFLLDELPVWIRQGFRFCMGTGRCYIHLFDRQLWDEVWREEMTGRGKDPDHMRIHPSTLMAMAKRIYPEAFEPHELPKPKTPKRRKRKAKVSIRKQLRKERAKDILRYIQEFGPVTTSEIAEGVDWSYPIVNDLLRRLVDMGYIEKSQLKAEGRGRPANVYRLRREDD